MTCFKKGWDNCSPVLQMIDNLYAKFLSKVQKPGRYVGGEFGSFEPKKEADVKMVLAFPDVYEIGMSHLGLSILYEIINNIKNFSAERLYMPWPDMIERLETLNLPLVTLESGSVLSEFDVVGFSLQYELTYTNLLKMLKLGGIPLRARDRGSDYPLVMVGGPVALHCSPIAPFVDLVILGDGEEILPLVLEKLAVLKKQGCPREEILKKLNEFSSVIVPSLEKKDTNCRFNPHSNQVVGSKTVAKVKSLKDYPTGAGPVPVVQAVFDRYGLEIARGCTEGCRFCQAGFIYRPLRERDKETIEGILNKATCQLGFDEVSLCSLSSANHSQIEPIIEDLGSRCLEERVSFSVPSLRAHGLSPKTIDVLSRMRASGVTLAPEAGSQRLRDVINKNITENDILNAVTGFFEKGFKKIKLYFMLGLPTETDDDLNEIILLVQKIRSIGRKMLGPRVIITISVSTFVPKPFTPFEREEMIGGEEIIRRQKLLYKAAHECGLKIKTHDVRLSILEGLFSRGDSKLASLLEEAVEQGAVFDGWDEFYRHDIWEKLLKNIDVNSYLSSIPESDELLWGDIDTGVSIKFRKQEQKKAYNAMATPPCGVYEESQEQNFICNGCGALCKKEDLPIKKHRIEVAKSPIDKIETKKNIVPHKVIQAGENPIRYRMEVAFWGRQAYVGHLDRMRHLMRSLKRASINLWYTQGFHPKPKIEAPPPMPLCTIALCEPFDLCVATDPGSDALERLNKVLPHDMEVVKFYQLQDGDKKLAHAFGAVEYIVLLDEDKAFVGDTIIKMLEASSIMVTRTRKGRIKNLDIRAFLMDAKIVDYDEQFLRIPVKSKKTAVSMKLRLLPSGGTRPDELLKAIMGEFKTEPLIVRTAWLKEKQNEEK